MKILEDAIDYLQRNDSNGTYEDLLEEVKVGEVALEEAKGYCVGVLQLWLSDLTDGDRDARVITEFIDDLQV